LREREREWATSDSCGKKREPNRRKKKQNTISIDATNK
jgi:hypothetical protein